MVISDVSTEVLTTDLRISTGTYSLLAQVSPQSCIQEKQHVIYQYAFVNFLDLSSAETHKAEYLKANDV